MARRRIRPTRSLVALHRIRDPALILLIETLSDRRTDRAASYRTRCDRDVLPAAIADQRADEGSRDTADDRALLLLAGAASQDNK